MSIIQGFLDGIKPDRLLTVSEWADLNRQLTSTSSAEPGRWRTARTPYLREIMDCLSASSPVQNVVVMKGAQVGMTEAGNNWLGYVIDQAPGPMLFVMTTLELAEKNSKMRLEPMLQGTEVLAKKMGPSKSRDGGNTKFLKEFPGGILSITGANSAAGMRSMPAKYIFLDEVDGYPLDLEGEGSPIELAKARSRTFPRRKIFALSTPTIQGASIIETEFDNTDQRFYHVPCPECAQLQILNFDQLRWEAGRYTDTERYIKTARYECEHCGHHIEERFKTVMLGAGQWIPMKPEHTSSSRRGYHINALYSPFGWFSWAEIAQLYDKAQQSQQKEEEMKTFTNTVLGLPYAASNEKPDWKKLFDRRETYAVNTISNDVFLITAGVDVQADRIEMEIVGWGKGKRSWSVDYRIFYGDPAKLEVWADLEAVLSETWIRPDLLELPLYRICVDSGYSTSNVYDWCSKWPSDRVLPVKGQDSLAVAFSAPRAVLRTTTGKEVKHGARVWQIGVSYLKSRLYGWLRNEITDDVAPFGYCRFPMYDELYFKGLTAEVLERRTVKGYAKYEWVKKFDRNEPLDTRVYALAAACIAGIDRWVDEDYDALVSSLPRKIAGNNQGPTIKPKKVSSFW